MNHDHPARRLVTRLLAVTLAIALAFGAVTLPSSATGGPTAGNGSGDVSAQTRPTRPPRGTTAPSAPTSTPIRATSTSAPATSTPVRATSTPIRATATAQATATRPARATTTPRPTVAVTATQRPSTGGGSAACPTGEEIVMLGLINDFRAQNGVGPLTLSPTLTAAADFHSRDMANRNYFSHDLPGIGTWSQNITNNGYTGGTRAENIAAGYSDAARTVQSWINSPGHRANMLNPSLRAVGIGSAYNANSQYGTYWTNDFGGTIDSAMSC